MLLSVKSTKNNFITKALLERGVDLNTVDRVRNGLKPNKLNSDKNGIFCDASTMLVHFKDRNTALLLSMQAGNLQVTQWLVNAGCDINIANKVSRVYHVDSQLPL